MKHKENEFNVYVWGGPGTKELMADAWGLSEGMTNETSAYLQSIGYKSRPNLPPGEFGATGLGLLWMILEGVPKVIPFLRIAIFLSKVLLGKYSRQLITSTDNKTSMQIVVEYKSELEHWVSHFNPHASKDKLKTMLDAGRFAYGYLKDKYPNISFSLSVQFGFSHGQASQTFFLMHSEVNELNIARFKKISSQTMFEKYKDKSFSISKRIFVKRRDVISDNKEKVYYFLIPSSLVEELKNKYTLLKYRMKEAN